jgi:tellurite methyltransferase
VNARKKWNARYRERGAAALERPPSEWLSENVGELDGRYGGRALDLACGTGRNAVLLAQLGFTVDALDISDVAIGALQGLLADRVHARVTDLEHEPLPEDRYDAIVLIDYLQRDLFTAIPRSLRPGGVVIAETVTRAHAEQLGNRFDQRYLLEPGELQDAFAGLQVLRYQECVAQRSGRSRAVASLVARRPE